MAEESRVKMCIDVLRHQNPCKVENDMTMLATAFLDEDEETELFGKVDLPHKLPEEIDGYEPKKPLDFVCCDYNRDGDSYRYPGGNDYHPPVDWEGHAPSKDLMNLEIEMNSVLQVYKAQYYDNKGYANAYFWDLDASEEFGCCVVIKKDFTDLDEIGTGSWNSMHVLTVKPDGDQKFKYMCVSSLILDLTKKPKGNAADEHSLSGSVSKMEESTAKVVAKHKVADHVRNIGTLVEELDTTLRNSITSLYFGKMGMVQQSLRHPNADKARLDRKMGNMANMAAAALQKKKKKREEA